MDGMTWHDNTKTLRDLTWHSDGSMEIQPHHTFFVLPFAESSGHAKFILSRFFLTSECLEYVNIILLHAFAYLFLQDRSLKLGPRVMLNKIMLGCLKIEVPKIHWLPFR